MKIISLSLALVVSALVSLAAQRPQQPPRVDESTLGPLEKQIPPDHYCKRAEIPIDPKREPRAHACSCSYSCTLEKDDKGNVIGITEDGGEHSSACKSYCSKNGRRCSCHVEEPCAGTLAHRHGFADMNGQVIAVRP